MPARQSGGATEGQPATRYAIRLEDDLRREAQVAGGVEIATIAGARQPSPRLKKAVTRPDHHVARPNHPPFRRQPQEIQAAASGIRTNPAREVL